MEAAAHADDLWYKVTSSLPKSASHVAGKANEKQQATNQLSLSDLASRKGEVASSTKR